MGRMAQGEPESDRQGSTPVGHEFSGGVVDRRDVVGVEGVAASEGVSGQPDPQSEGLGAQAVVVRGDERCQGDPADQVQRHNDRHHAAHPDPFGPAQRVSDQGQARCARGVRSAGHGMSLSWLCRNAGHADVKPASTLLQLIRNNAQRAILVTADKGSHTEAMAAQHRGISRVRREGPRFGRAHSSAAAASMTYGAPHHV